MKSYTITVNGTVYDVTVEEKAGGSSAPGSTCSGGSTCSCTGTSSCSESTGSIR